MSRSVSIPALSKCAERHYIEKNKWLVIGIRILPDIEKHNNSRFIFESSLQISFETKNVIIE